MNLVTLEKITKQYGERVLLSNAELRINTNEHIGLLGRNGSGKSTLLRLIAGLESPDQGEVTIWGKVRVRYLSQEPNLDGELTVLETVYHSDAPLMRLLRNYESASLALQERPSDQAAQTELIKLSEEMDQGNGWAAEAEAKSILTELGINNFNAKVATLSGGQKRRVALAQVLIDPGDLLILDEPTNHIDADTVAWLEPYLQKMNASLLMVTHDRYFLQRVANRIVELDRRELLSYTGSYRDYLEAREEREAQLAVREEKRQSLLKRELVWLRRGAQARSTKQKARKQRIEEMQDVQYDRADDKVAMAMAGRRLGKRVLEAYGLSKAFGEIELFKDLDFELLPGERIGILGPNGAGKSSFLNVLSGRLPADSGELAWGETVELGYFDQQSEELQDRAEQMLGDYIEDISPLMMTKDGERVTAPQMLEWFLFPRNEQRNQIGTLSGGEKRRLYLLRVLAQRPNVLFLDEPTNDLDIQTLTVLEQFLDHFKGTLVVISHDRYFLDRNVDFIMSFEDGVLGTRYPSPYQPKKRQETKSGNKSVKTEKTAAKTAPKSKKLSWKEKRELEEIEAKMPQLEEKIAEIEETINQIGSEYQRLPALTAELEAANSDLETIMERWLVLSEIAEAQ